MIDQLRAFLDGPYADVRDEVRDGLRRPELAPAIGLSRDEHRQRVLAQMKRLAEERKSVARGFPEEHGGADEVGAFVSGFETLGHGDLSLLVKVGVQFGLFGGAIHQLGTERHHAAWLPGVISVDLPGCFAMTETGHGSNVQALETSATYDPDTEEWVIRTPTPEAQKDYIGNAAEHGRAAVVFAQLVTGDEEHGVHAFFVPIRDDAGEAMPGVEIEDCGDKVGLNGVDNGRLRFHDVRVPRENLLDRFGSVAPDGTYASPIEDRDKRFFTMLGTLVQGRVSVSGASLSAAKNALTIATRYALDRRQFSPPGEDTEVLLMDYLVHQRRLLPRIAESYALSAAQQMLVTDLHAVRTQPDHPERERRKLESRAAGIKAFTTWHAMDTIQECREACGGVGYLQENRLGQLRDDIDVFTTFEGDNTVLLQLVAKGLLTSYRDEFGSMDTLGTVRFVADQVFEAVIERTAARQLIQTLIDAVPGNDEEADVRDRGWHLDLFEYRENHVLDGLGRRLKKGIDAGYDPFDVFNRAQDHVLLAARAHIDRVVLESFVAQIAEVDDDDTRALLDRVCDLYVLSLLERERGWFLEHGRFTGARSKAIIDAVNEVCRELRPYARELVDAYAIPDQALMAPIATSPAPATS